MLDFEKDDQHLLRKVIQQCKKSTDDYAKTLCFLAGINLLAVKTEINNSIRNAKEPKKTITLTNVLKTIDEKQNEESEGTQNSNINIGPYDDEMIFDLEPEPQTHKRRTPI